MLRRLIVVLAIVSAVAPGFPQAPAAPAKPDLPMKASGNCAVSGRVVSAAEGAPLRSARVALVEANERKRPLVYAATTDNEGRFEIKQIMAGRYEFVASHTGYLEQQYKSKGIQDEEGAMLSLISGQTVNDVMFRLVRAGVITGKVVDDAGEPLMGVNVSVLHKPSEEEHENEGPRGKKLALTMVSGGQTDDRGEYRIFNLRPGEYYLKAADTGRLYPSAQVTDWRVKEAVGSPFAPIYYPGVLQLDQAQTIALSAGEEAQADFAMRKVKMVEVAGRVIGPDGGPVSGAYVQLSQAGVEDWGTELGASVDNSGEFSIKGVPPGNYAVSASMHEKDKFYNTSQKLTVGEEKIDSIVLALGAGATIHGRVRTANGAALPPGHWFVHLRSVGQEGPTGSGHAEVNKDGSYELSGVTDGGYALHAGFGEPGPWFVKSAYLGNEDAFDNGVQVEGGAVKGSLDIVISNDGAQIEGTVTDSEKENPMAGVKVTARIDPATDYNYMRTWLATTDQNGRYVMKDIPPRKYKVTAKMPPAAAGLPDVKSEAVSVSLGERDHKVMDFKLTVPKSE